jgi:hypothetical protein
MGLDCDAELIFGAVGWPFRVSTREVGLKKNKEIFLTGLHFTSVPKNLSRVYKYLTLSLASLAASVILASCS